MKLLIKWFVVTLFSCLLCACGFHLRQNLDLPKDLDSLYVSSPTPYGQFEEYLRTILRTSDINITDDAEDANYMLRITMHQVTQSATSISLNTQTRSYTLTYQVKYDLTRHGVTILPTQVLSISQNYLTSSSQLSYTDDAQMKNTIQSMQHDIAEQIINRLSSDDVKKMLAKKHS